MIDDNPVIFEIDYFTKEFDCVLRKDFRETPLLVFLRKETVRRAAGIDSICEIKRANKELIRHLGCSSGTPLLKVSQTVFSENGGVLYFNKQYIRSEHYKYTMRTTIDGAEGE